MSQRTRWKAAFRTHWRVYLALIVAVISAGIVWYRIRAEPAGGTLPEIGEVTAMRAFLDEYGSGEYFNVPQKYWQQILDEMRPATVDDRYAKWAVLGSLKIEIQTHKNITLVFFYAPEDVGAYMDVTNDAKTIRYRGGDSERLRQVLKAARAEVVAAK